MNTDSVPTGTDAVEEKLPNVGVRVMEVFTSPGKLFSALAARPVWLGALVLVLALSVVSQVIIPEEVLRQSMLDSVGPDASADQIAAVENMAGFARIIQIGSTVIVGPLFMAFIAGLLMLVYSVIMGGTGTFAQMFSVVTHASIISAVGGLLGSLVIMATADVDRQLTLRLLAPGTADDSFIAIFLNGMNIFVLWAFVAMGIGVSRVYPKVSAGSAIGLILGSYVAVVAIIAAIRA
jgi:hypothetical protein